MTFTFISRYRNETSFRHTASGQRYRLFDDGKLTVDGMEPDLDSFRAFRKWQEASHAEEMAAMRADPAKFPPDIVAEVDKPIFAKPCSWWQWFDNLALDAAETEDGKAFVAAGFSLYHTGGGCTAWSREIPDTGGCEILITNGDSGHLRDDPDDDYWVGGYNADGEGFEDLSGDGFKTAALAIANADEIANAIKQGHGVVA